MTETATCSRIEQGARCRLPAGHGGDCYLVKDIGPTGHALDGTRTPDRSGRTLRLVWGTAGTAAATTHARHAGRRANRGDGVRRLPSALFG